MHRLSGPRTGQCRQLRNDKCIEDFSSVSVGAGEEKRLTSKKVHISEERNPLTEFIHSLEGALGEMHKWLMFEGFLI